MYFFKESLSNRVDALIGIAWKVLLFSFPYFLIFNLKISNAIIISLSSLAFIAAIRRRQMPGDFRGMLWCSSLFLMSLLAATYSTDFKQGMLDVESRLPLILLPIAFSLRYPTKQELQLLLKHFYLSIGLTFIVCLAFAFYRNYLDPWDDIWFNQWYYHYVDFTEPIDIHPLYLSLYVNLAIVILIIDLVKLETLSNLPNRLKISVLLGLMIFQVMLGSRSALLILVCVVLAIFYFARKYISRYWLLGFFIFGILLFALVIISPVTRERFRNTFTIKYDFSTQGVDRLIIWFTALEYVEKNPEQFILGHGTGSSTKLMDSLYIKNKVNWDFEQKNSTHNQYLDFLLNMGLFGLGWLVFFFIHSLKKFVTHNDWIGIAFIILMSLSLISENYLNRQKGIAFFGFVYCLLFLRAQKSGNQSFEMANDSN